MLTTIRLSFVSALLTVLCSTTSIAADSTFVTAGSMVDTLSGSVLDKPLIEIQGDRIVSVSSGESAPAGANVIDLGQEATLIPGLADMHTHLTYDLGDFGYKSLAISETDEAIRGVANARTTLMAGFTSARNLGASGYADVSLREAIDSGRIPGPRLQVSGPSLSATGGHCDNNLLPDEYNATAGGVADGPWAARAVVRKHRKYGADVIKICATGGTLSRRTDPGARQYTDEELQAIIDEAHMLGMQVAAHAHGTEGITALIKAGVDSVEHCSLMDEEGLRLARRNGTFLSVNAYTPKYMLANGLKNGILPESLEKARKLSEKRFETYRMLIRENAKVVFGSDSATIPHGDNAKQFAVYVELGMTPMRAIQSATTVAAESLGWEGQVGAIAPGYFADIIAVNGDPIDDITVMEDVRFVMKGGEIYKEL